MHLLIEDRASVPSITWRWEPETDILAGTLRPQDPGVSGTLELSAPDGSVAVVDLLNGAIAGIDVVVWPEVVTLPDLYAPSTSRQGAVRVVQPSGEGATVLEMETPLSARANATEDMIHLRVGAPRPAQVVRVADQLLVEVDEGGGLAGFWLCAVPPLLSGENGH